jgi:uncharacterized protein YeaO (DUF488 family)
MAVKTKRVYDKAEPGDGYRLLVMRMWPRGISRDRVDAWDRRLGTPVELIRDWKNGAITWGEFARGYRMSLADRKEKLAQLAQRARRGNVTLLCGCNDEQHCHRTILKRIIEKGVRRG